MPNKVTFDLNKVKFDLNKVKFDLNKVKFDLNSIICDLVPTIYIRFYKRLLQRERDFLNYWCF